MKGNAMMNWDVEKIGLFEINFETGHAYWSRELRNLLGVAYDVPAAFELLLQCIHADDRRGFAIAAARTFQPNAPSCSTIQVRFVRPNGVVQRVHIESDVVFRDGPPRDAIRVVGIVAALPLDDLNHVTNKLSEAFSATERPLRVAAPVHVS